MRGWSTAGVSTRWARGFVTGAVVVTAGVLILLGLQADGTMAAVLLLVGFGLTNATNPIGMLTVSEISPVKQRSAILAVWQSLVTLGGVVASIGVGVLADHAIGAGGTAVDGYELAFAIAAIAAVVGGAGLRLAHQRPPRRRPTGPAEERRPGNGLTPDSPSCAEARLRSVGFVRGPRRHALSEVAAFQEQVARMAAGGGPQSSRFCAVPPAPPVGDKAVRRGGPSR